MATQLEDIQTKLGDLTKRIATEGITSNTGEILLPKQEQVTPDISTALGRTSYYQQFIKDEEARVIKAEADRQALIKDREAQRTKQSGILGLLKGVGTKRTEELTTLGYDPTAQFAQQKAKLAEVDALYKDYNDAVAQRDQALANVENRTGTTLDFMNAESARINRNANVILTQKSSNINSKLALMEAMNNNWTEAQKFVDQSIKDYTAGLTADYNMLESFIDDNSDLISSLGTEYTNALNSRKSLMLDQISQAATDKQNEIDNDFKQQGLDIQAFNAQKESTPASYKEWQYAGGLQGTGKTYAQWINSSDVKNVPWSVTAAQLGLVGVPQNQANDILSSDSPPTWFTQKANELTQKSFPVSYWKSAWDEYAKPIREKAKSGSSALDQIINILGQ